MRKALLLTMGIALLGVLVFSSVTMAARITGTSGPDVIVGTDGQDRLAGGGGNDEIRARAGRDHVDGDSGSDDLLGQAGADRVVGSQGNDRLRGGTGDDFLNAKDESGGDVVACDGGVDDFSVDPGDIVRAGCENEV